MQTVIGNWHLYKYIDVAGRSRYVNNQLFFSKLLLDTWAEGGEIYKIVFLQFLPSPHPSLYANPPSETDFLLVSEVHPHNHHLHTFTLPRVHKMLVNCFGRKKKDLADILSSKMQCLLH